VKRTPLYQEHVELGAKLISFAGWEMPVFYTSIIEEHVAVRRSAGIFDVSHMGDLIIRGKGAKELIRGLITNELEGIEVGRAVYGHILDEEGRIIDDVIVYHWREGEYLMVPNAATTDRVLGWVNAHKTTQEVIDVSERLACIALQGPIAAEVLKELTLYDLPTLKHMSGGFMELFAEGRVIDELIKGFQPSGFLCDLIPRQCRPGTKGTYGDFSETCYVSRTGYTGEDGFEILLEKDSATALWRILLHIAKSRGLLPCGLGARDTLRLEMGYLLSGTDFDGTQTSLQTGPRWVIKPDHYFIGKEALARQQVTEGFERLVCLELLEKGIPRHGYFIHADGEVVGKITSGTLSPCLRKGIAMGYVRPPHHMLGTELEIAIRGASVKARVVNAPFYRRKKV
jgi:aminomethyltransferase